MTPAEYSMNVKSRFGTIRPWLLARMENGKLPKIHDNTGNLGKSGRERTIEGRRKLNETRLAARDAAYVAAIGNKAMRVNEVAPLVGFTEKATEEHLRHMFERGKVTREKRQDGNRRWLIYSIAKGEGK